MDSDPQKDLIELSRALSAFLVNTRAFLRSHTFSDLLVALAQQPKSEKKDGDGVK